ncbi:hypothetical protein HPB47_013553 [Ixodes persulcatus]|uniref:Uncharacterized protein n=1 Tax=Ixodes persulcatus TaxID=34615 RepID=A0AC60R1N4_IXOPE|nr:hypothetical protein HPB47_013553 [Ixodes persulcatus]
MHCSLHTDRRIARAKALGRILGGSDEVLYVDAASCGKNTFALAVVNGHFKLVNSATVTARSPGETKICAIVLALCTGSHKKAIVSDSKRAIIAYSKVNISITVIRILRQVDRLDSGVELVWTPAHSGLQGNEAAHEAARGLINRAASNDDSEAPFEPIYTFHEITHHYSGSRGCYPLRVLLSIEGCRWCGDSFRLTHFSHRHDLVTYIYPDLFSPQCTRCPPPNLDYPYSCRKADLTHILWFCPANPPPEGLKAKVESSQWKTLLLNWDEESPRLIINWALSVSPRWPPGSTE